MTQTIRSEWKSIYSMLIYTIEELKHVDMDNKNCKSIDDLLASMICKSIELLYQNDYTALQDTGENTKISGYSSKIALESGKSHTEYNESNINSIHNIAIKSAVNCLITYGKNISKHHRAYLAKVIDDLEAVRDTEAIEIDYNDIDNDELTAWYKATILVSKIITAQLLGKDKSNSSRLFRLDDNERIKYILEEFIRNIYKTEYKDGETSSPIYKLYNRRNSLDIMIENKSTILIINTKWYESSKIKYTRANNEREVTEYITSRKEYETSAGLISKETFGMILYNRTDGNEKVLNTDEVRSLGSDYGKCTICERTINLNQEFSDLKRDLINLANEFIK